MANRITYNLKTGTPIQDGVPTVYRMTFGKRYFIWKGKSLDHSVKTIAKDLGRKTENLPSEEDLFYSMAAYMKRFRVFHFTIEVLLQTDDHQLLIDFERNELLRCQGDPNCSNLVYVPHIPAWISPAVPKIPEPVRPEANKAPESTKILKDGTLPGKEIKVEQAPEKAAPAPSKEPVSTNEIEMPDIDMDDISDLLDGFKKWH